MQSSIRKVGNSAGMTIPASLFKSQGFVIGDTVDIEEHDGYLVVRKVTEKPKYTLEQLLAECDSNAQEVDELSVWSAAENVGNEIW